MILDEWADNSQFELFPMMAELTIRTASACLMGREIREQLHSNGTKPHSLNSFSSHAKHSCKALP